MKLEIKVPSPGESITEVQIARWLKKEGDQVEKDEEIAEIDSDKATLTIAAEDSGTLSILVKEGETIPVGSVIGGIDTAGTGNSISKNEKKEATPAPVQKIPESVAADGSKNGKTDEKNIDNDSEKSKSYASGVPSPAAAKIMKEQNIIAAQVTPSGKDGRITKADVLSPKVEHVLKATSENTGREQRKEKMSMLRKKISQRLVAVKNETAMLTTFNEVDMSAIMEIRKLYKDKFKEKYGIGLGFMSFFTKAVCIALKEFPAVNAMIDGDEIVYHNYCDIGIAVSAPKGLMVPVVRDAQSLSMADIEKEISNLAGKARDGKITVNEMTGGTFTITNGGVFGSMLSTPILNPPQSAILGMHNIVERPMAINGNVVIKPIMYVALSYDHRVIDGRESVSFLVKVKQMLEMPSLLFIEGKDPVKNLLGI